MSKIRFVGLDVHAETVAVAVAEPNGEVRSLGLIPNRPESIRQLVRKLQPVEQVRFCYEAGPTGYVLYWQLTALGAKCEVVAPSLVPTKPGDRVKTDRRDALKLARCYRAGDLTPVWVPDAAHEALRDLVRAREAAKGDLLRARHRLSKFLLRHGWRRPESIKSPWTNAHLEWIKTKVHFEQLAQEIALSDYVHQVEHLVARIERLDQAVLEAARSVPPQMRAVIEALQALRGDCASHGGDHRRRTGRDLALRESQATDGIQWPGSQRILQRRTRTAGRHHQDRQRTFETRHCRSRLGLSVPTLAGRISVETPGRTERRRERDCLEGPASVARALPKTAGTRKEQTADRNRRGARIARIYLGHRSEGRNKDARTETSSSLSQRTTGGRQCGWRSSRTRKGESS